MFREIVRFELRYQMRTPAFGLILLVFFLLGFGAACSDIVQVSGSGGDVHRNAPSVILSFLSFMSLAGVLLTTALLAPAVARDAELDTEAIFFATPLRKPAYLFGRFFGGFAAVVVVFVASVLGLMLGSRMPWLDAAELGPFWLAPYLQAFFVIALPNLFISGAVLFTIAAYTRSIRWTYVGVIGLVVGYGIASSRLRNLDNELLATLIDPFAFGAVFKTTKYWTVLDKNTRLLPIGQAVVLNRALWVGIGSLLLAANLALFRLHSSSGSAKALAKAQPEVSRSAPVVVASLAPTTTPTPFALTWARFLSQTRMEVSTLLRSAVFLVCLLFGVINVVMTSLARTHVQGTTVLPVTHLMVSSIQGAFSLTMLIVLAFATGEVVFRDRMNRMDGIIDSISVPTWVLWSSKLIAVVAVLLSQLVLATIAAVVLQLSKGYTHLELLQYVKGVFLVNGYSFILMSVLALFFQVITQNRYVGYMLVVLFLFSQPILGALHFNHLLYQFASTPDAPYSDMNGYGPFTAALGWFNVYWAFGAVLLCLLIHLFWLRGVDARFKARFVEAGRRLVFGPRLLLVSSSILFLLTGGYIFYNTNVRNKYRTDDQVLDDRADFEKKYKKYESAVVPQIVSAHADVDIFPSERAAVVRGKYMVENQAKSSIETIFISRDPRMDLKSLVFSGSSVETEDKKLGMMLLKLSPPMAPGEKREMTFEVHAKNPGFRNNGEDLRFVPNGTFFDNFGIFPQFGYLGEDELMDPAERRKRGLEAITRMPKLEDEAARGTNYISRDSHWLDFDTVVSTSEDQIALAPGYLQKEWREGGRRFFHYKMDAPILGFWSYLSARYEVRKDKYEGVDIEVYYHPDHPYEVERMIEAVKLSLETFTKAFGPYQHRQVRILEFPSYRTFAQSFPNTIPYSEAIGFIVKPPKGDEVDLTTFVTAHEVAHQWWAHQVIGARMQGSTLLSESLAEYSALVVMEKLAGREKLRRFLKQEVDGYLRGRGGEFVEELPLLRVENQAYVHYNKGGMTFFALRDLLGAEVLDGVLRAFVVKYKQKGPPYPTSRELVDDIIRVTPTEKRKAIEDWLETITIYDGALTSASWKKREDGKFDVKIAGTLDKIHADGHGNESPAPIDDYIDIGLFAGETSENNPLGKRLVVETRHITEKAFTFSLVVDEKPAKAWIDPYVLRVDRDLDNNDEEVVEAK